MGLAAQLRDARIRAGLTQREAARQSGVGAKSISAFETGARVETIQLVVLARLLNVYQTDLAEFFRGHNGDHTMRVSKGERFHCPKCRHHDDKHRICRDCAQAPHVLCVGTVPHPKNPLQLVPCHCTWSPDEREVSGGDQ